MSDSMEELLHKLACETALPRSRTASRKTEIPPTAKPYTRAQAKIGQRATLAPNSSLQPPSLSKKRGRKPDFGIFVDSDAANAPFFPCPKKLKSNERIALTLKTDLANDGPVPPPRCPGVPFPLSPADPRWENAENYDPRPCYMTPPPTPRSFSPTPSPSPHPTPESSPRRPSRASRTRQAQQPPSPWPLLPPKDMTLYVALDLNNWRATSEEIKVAHHKYAREHHPDKVAPERREEATHLMQTANAAAEVLLDCERRKAYHRSGRLPWTT